VARGTPTSTARAPLSAATTPPLSISTTSASVALSSLFFLIILNSEMLDSALNRFFWGLYYDICSDYKAWSLIIAGGWWCRDRACPVSTGLARTGLPEWTDNGIKSKDLDSIWCLSVKVETGHALSLRFDLRGLFVIIVMGVVGVMVKDELNHEIDDWPLS